MNGNHTDEIKEQISKLIFKREIKNIQNKDTLTNIQ